MNTIIHGLGFLSHAIALIILGMIYVDPNVFGGITTTVAFGVAIGAALLHLAIFGSGVEQNQRPWALRELVLTSGVLNILICAALGRLLEDPEWNSRAFIGFAISIIYCVAEFHFFRLKVL